MGQTDCVRARPSSGRVVLGVPSPYFVTLANQVSSLQFGPCVAGGPTQWPLTPLQCAPGQHGRCALQLMSGL
eukprot:2206678-Pleurochrysis_carterae.AAC.2